MCNLFSFLVLKQLWISVPRSLFFFLVPDLIALLNLVSFVFLSLPLTDFVLIFHHFQSWVLLYLYIILLTLVFLFLYGLYYLLVVNTLWCFLLKALRHECPIHVAFESYTLLENKNKSQQRNCCPPWLQNFTWDQKLSCSEPLWGWTTCWPFPKACLTRAYVVLLTSNSCTAMELGVGWSSWMIIPSKICSILTRMFN